MMRKTENRGNEQQNRISTKIRYAQIDFWLLLVVVLLLGIGTMMVFSASSAAAYTKTSHSTAYDILKAQIFYAISGIAVMLIVSLFDYKFIGRFSFVLYAITIFLLLLVQTPLGKTYNGARRWLNLGIEFQPSEILKLAAVLFMAYVLSNPQIREKSIRLWGILIYGVPLMVGIGLVAIQPHISCVVIVGGVVVLMMFVGGVKAPTFLVGIVSILLLGAGIFLFAYTTGKLDFTYIQERINIFMHPESDPSNKGYQIMQSLYAIGSGGLFGRGFGKSVQKYLYLPEPYNDFIFSILAEELGFVGVALVILLFMLLLSRGYKISSNAPDRFGSLVAFGITTNIAIQVVMNIAVVSNFMPVTGVSLPFFSYGGTSLWIIMANMGILLNISKQSRYAKF